MADQRLRPAGEWLRRMSLLAGDVAARYTAFFNSEEWFSRFAVEEKDQTRFGSDTNRWLALVLKKYRRRGDVVVPKVMMNRLEGPDYFPRFAIQGHERVGMPIVARA